jgi:demethylmenaquinone methyltransferase/2-methoxy-6-polyprenyl-1,4-benzoquinol methylase
MREEELLQEQIEYYRARAAEYDEWFLRLGRYDHGPEHRKAWLGEVAGVEAALEHSLPRGDILEIACGTGWWTSRLVDQHRRVTAVDASPEAISINRSRVASGRVEYVVADVFEWAPPSAAFDGIFFGFWLSHVPRSKFDAFWDTVKTALKPDGLVFFVDSLMEQTASARDQSPVDHSGVALRTLNDGRQFRVVKKFYEPQVLEQQLVQRGWNGHVRSSGRFFLYGSMTLAGAVGSA